MRTRALPVLAAVAAAALLELAGPVSASPYCQDLGPVPGYGPVCTVQCVLGADPTINPKDVRGTLESLIVVCPA